MRTWHSAAVCWLCLHVWVWPLSSRIPHLTRLGREFRGPDGATVSLMPCFLIRFSGGESGSKMWTETKLELPFCGRSVRSTADRTCYDPACAGRPPPKPEALHKFFFVRGLLFCGRDEEILRLANCHGRSACARSSPGFPEVVE